MQLDSLREEEKCAAVEQLLKYSMADWQIEFSLEQRDYRSHFILHMWCVFFFFFFNVHGPPLLKGRGNEFNSVLECTTSHPLLQAENLPISRVKAV